MDVNAKLSFIRVSNRKINLMAKDLRGKGLQDALNILQYSSRRKVADLMSTLLKSAMSNAMQKGTIDVDTLFVKSIEVGQGPTLKRFLTRAKGSASPLKKRTAHVNVVLSER